MTETLDKQAAHRRGVTVTTVACLTGVAAGLGAHVVASGATDRLGVALLVAAAALNLGIVRVLGVDVEGFSAKDHLYTAFMTFALWFVTWGVLLSA
ncbi:EMC6-like membrane protein [Halarchaeum nitratireducens]|uniref:Uncharacterized protein n=1 Tax=Halarchaeum nitratireducens TaxID=489913 RepID=A0A830G7M8_9EURY|nr:MULTISPECIES: hypothetical protein [Halarchaeum]MBP2251912.1 hypothetical protein [Halarchaeum solikamskense]GGN06144.1 hypothetical protein GCM10009021_01340 [Halarchaeum nitratireducens]